MIYNKSLGHNIRSVLIQLLLITSFQPLLLILTRVTGEREGYLHVDIEFPHDIQGYLKTRYLKDASSDYALYITNAIEQACKHYLLPIFAAEVRARAAGM